MLDLVQVNRRENVSLWSNVGPGDRRTRSRWATGSRVRPEQAGPNRDAIGSWIEVRFGDRTVEREVTIGGGHASGELGWIHFGLGDADAPRSGSSGPTARSGPGMESPPTRSSRSARGGATARRPGRPRNGDVAMTGARLAEIDLPDFGMPDAMPEIPAAVYADRLERLRARADEARLRPRSSSTPTASTARTSRT